MIKTYAAAPESVDADGKRIAHRHKVFLPVQMTVAQEDMRVHLINVSATGALAHHDTPPSRGTSVGIAFGDRTIGGRIVWCDGRRFGIAFSDRLSEQALGALFGDQVARQSTGLATPGA